MKLIKIVAFLALAIWLYNAGVWLDCAITETHKNLSITGAGQ